MQNSGLGAFRFLNLPIEIRWKIYDKYFTGSQILIQDARGHQTQDLQHELWEQRWDHYWEFLHENAEATRSINTNNFPLALTQTSSRIRAESRPILTATTHLYIMGLELHLALHLVPASFRSRIKHLTLSKASTGLGRPCLHLELLEPAGLHSLETLTMHYDIITEFGIGLSTLLRPGFNDLKHFEKSGADHLDPDKIRSRMRLMHVPFDTLAQLSQVVPFQVKLQVHMEGFWTPDDIDEDEPWPCACLCIVFDMATEEITRIGVGKWDHENIWAHAAEEEAVEEDHERVL